MANNSSKPQTNEHSLLSNGPSLVISEAASYLVERIIEYRIPTGRPIILILECSGTKPWTFSHSRRILAGLLTGANWREKVEILTLSSMLGIVPSCLEQEFPAANYDWDIDGENPSHFLEYVLEINRRRVRDFFDKQSGLESKTCIAATHGRYKKMLGDVGTLFGRFTDLGWSDTRDYRSLDIVRVHDRLIEELSSRSYGSISG